MILVDMYYPRKIKTFLFANDCYVIKQQLKVNFLMRIVCAFLHKPVAE